MPFFKRAFPVQRTWEADDTLSMAMPNSAHVSENMVLLYFLTIGDTEYGKEDKCECVWSDF